MAKSIKTTKQRKKKKKKGKGLMIDDHDDFLSLFPFLSSFRKRKTNNQHHPIRYLRLLLLFSSPPPTLSHHKSKHLQQNKITTSNAPNNPIHHLPLSLPPHQHQLHLANSTTHHDTTTYRERDREHTSFPFFLSL